MTEQQDMRTTFPTRHREAEDRGRRIGGALWRYTRRTGPMDEALFDRLGAALLECDEAAAKVAVAMRMRADAPERVTHRDVRKVLTDGPDPATPAVLREFMELLYATPDWVDWDRIDRGGQVFSRLGASAGDALLQVALFGGYRFGGPPDLLVATGALRGSNTLRRLAETQHWTLSLMKPGALRPGAEGWRNTVHVRLMHALVNDTYRDTWDIERWGLPINQGDQAGTLGLFDLTTMICCQALGIPLTKAEMEDVLHLWKYTGWLMGVHEDFLTDVVAERAWLNMHVAAASPGPTSAGPLLAHAVLEAQVERDFGLSTAGLNRLRGRLERERMLSMMSVFLGPHGMRELGLPRRPPWAFAMAAAGNLLQHRLTGRDLAGKARNVRRGRIAQQRGVMTYLKSGAPSVGPLPSGTTEKGTVA